MVHTHVRRISIIDRYNVVINPKVTSAEDATKQLSKTGIRERNNYGFEK